MLKLVFEVSKGLDDMYIISMCYADGVLGMFGITFQVVKNI